MSKTVSIPDKIHIIITKKQIEFREKYGINLKISDIISFLVEHNIDGLKDVIRDGVLQRGVPQRDTAKKDDATDNISETKNGNQNLSFIEETEIKE